MEFIKINQDVQSTSTIYEILRQSTKYSGDRHRGEIGVEIETETTKEYVKPQSKYWNVVADGSLRDFGQEYVLKAPMSIPEFERALAEFDTFNKEFKFKTSSVSTSVHVHLNFLNDTYLSLANFLTIYALVENLLIRYSGPDRLSNLFCLPICDAEGVKDKLIHMLSMINRGFFAKSSLQSEQVKYGAINAAPLNRIGTMEVRCFRGETDVRVIQKWINILMAMKNYARRPDLTPPKVLDLWKNYRGVFLDVIFGEYSKELHFVKDGKDLTETLIKENLKYAADIASVSRDWAKFGLLKVKPVYKEKVKGELDKLCRNRFNKDYDTAAYYERILVIEEYHSLNKNVRIVDVSEDI